MNRVLRSGLLALALVAVPATAQAQVTLGPTLAYHDDADLGIGATVGLPLTALHEQINFLGDLVIFFPEGFDYFEVNANLTYDIPVENASVLPFVLGGLNIARASVDLGPGLDGSDTQMGLNLGGGIKFDAGPVRPTVGLRLELDGGDGFVFFGTIPFVLGG